jgi:hypothetical protein
MHPSIVSRLRFLGAVFRVVFQEFHVNVTSTTTAPVLSLDATRDALASGVKGTGDLIRNYASAMCREFNLVNPQGEITTPWYDLKGALAKGVKGERTKFVDAFTQRGLDKPTIDVYWGRVKDASGRVKTQNRVTGGAQVDAQNLADLKTIINRIFKAEEADIDTPWSNVKEALMDAFEMMGGDTDTLG